MQCWGGRSDGVASPQYAAASRGQAAIAREQNFAGINVNQSLTRVYVHDTAVNLVVYEGHVDITRVFLTEGALETATDNNGCRPVAFFDKVCVEKNPLKEPWIRSLLVLALAFRAHSSLWPPKSAAETSTSSSNLTSVLELGGIGGDLGKEEKAVARPGRVTSSPPPEGWHDDCVEMRGINVQVHVRCSCAYSCTILVLQRGKGKYRHRTSLA